MMNDPWTGSQYTQWHVRGPQTARTLSILCMAALVAAPVAPALANLDVTPNLTADQLVAALVGNGVETQNATLTVGAGTAVGSFTGGTAIIGFESGIILSTGNAADVPGPNDQASVTTDHSAPGDTDLDAIAGVATFDAAILEFDFRCESIASISFQYVFSSDEYNEFVDGGVNDAFAFFVDGTNIALLPDGVTPVSINTVNCGNPYNASDPDPGCAYYINNDCVDLPVGSYPCDGDRYTEMDGLTVVLDAAASVTAGQWHHMKIAIADGADGSLDSNVFIKGASLVCGAPGDLPATVTTTAASSIALTTASSGGNVTDGGSTAVSARGVCWNTSGAPTTADSKTTDGSGTGSFTSSLTGLTANTTYHVRAYATNGAGTTYGDEITFSTLADTDGDGTPDDSDGCPNDPNKIAAGACGCGVAETDDDGDGTPNCNDQCPNDPNKLVAGTCGCGTADTDTDGDGTPDCNDQCPNDPNKTAPGTCGCGAADTDSDSDGTPDCNDACSNDPNKALPGACGCGVAETDTDGDGTPNCHDTCPADPNKTAPGVCGCGTPDSDSDGDGTRDCDDQCPNDPNKIQPGTAGCGQPEPTDAPTDEPDDDTTETRPNLQVTIVPDNADDGSPAASSPKVGDEMSFLVDVSNIGDGQATSVIVTVPLPPNVEVVSARLITTPSAADLPDNITIVGDTLIIDCGDIPPGDKIQLNLILRAKSSGQIILEPSARSEEQPEQVKAAEPPALNIEDVHEMIVTTYRPISFCGTAGLLPLMAIGLLLGLHKRVARSSRRR